MSILTKELDLLKFINQKCQKELDVAEIKILNMASKTMYSAILKTFEKFSINAYCLECMTTINNLFWVILSYSNNLKLTMFLCDRAILLFNEYILMTKKMIYDKNNTDVDNLSEVKIFIYKKTIGPIMLKDQNNTKSNSKIKNSLIHDKLRTIGNIIYNSHYNAFLTLCKDNISLEDITKKLDVYNNNLCLVIIELLNKMNNENLQLVSYMFDNIVENSEFSEFTVIQKYNTLCILCYIIEKIDIETTDKSIYITNILNKCKTNYKLKYIKVDNILINSNEFKEIFFVP